MARAKPRRRLILITGATDGIGFRLAKAYASRGHFVLATGRQTLTDDATFFGVSNITYIRADQSQPEQAARAIEVAMARFGWPHLDVAILNAATGWAGHPAQETADSISGQVTINLTAPILIARTIAPALFAGRGQLVLIGSTAASGQPSFATYAATKAGLEGFARSLREEWRAKAHVQIIHPGPVRTKMHAKAGLKLRVARLFFMSPRRAVRAIQHSIRNQDRRRVLSRSYGLSALFARLFNRAREGEL